MSFNQFILREQYLRVKGLGDRLELMKGQIDWKPFIPLVRKRYLKEKKAKKNGENIEYTEEEN